MLSVILFLESLGGGELLVILLFVLIFFGSKNIPSLARGLGKGIREFKDAMNGVQSELRQGMHEVERQVEQAGEPEPKKVINTTQEIPAPEENKSIPPPPVFTPPSDSQARS